MKRILLLCDNLSQYQPFVRAARAQGDEVVRKVVVDAALESLLESDTGQRFDEAVIDATLLSATVTAIAAKLHAAFPLCRIIVCSALPNVADAVAALKAGAEDYWARPERIAALYEWMRSPEHILADDTSDPDLLHSIERVESDHIQRALALFKGNISATAAALKMPRRTLQRKLAHLREAP